MKTAPTSTDTVRIYLREIGRVPLLTHEQEVVFGKQVQQSVNLMAIKNNLTEQIGREPTLAEWGQAANLEPLWPLEN
jgi:RNA polymerase nonessential primary-like sigma factor